MALRTPAVHTRRHRFFQDTKAGSLVCGKAFRQLRIFGHRRNFGTPEGELGPGLNRDLHF